MKVSMFTRVIELPKACIAYSMMTGGIVAIPRELGRLSELPENSQSFQSCVDLGILVPEATDEVDGLGHWFDKARRERDTLRFTVLTTFQCNFACVYCVEDGVKGPIMMREELVAKMVAMIIQACLEANPKTLHIQFYGGEPLLNFPAIMAVSKRLFVFCQKNDIELVLSMITNGSLLRPEFMRELVALGMRYLQITLDGPREAHNQKRPYKGGRPSFDDILKNIQDIATMVGVNLACNVDEENEGEMPQLLDYLEEIGLKGKIKRLSFNPINQRTPEGSQPCALFSLTEIKELTAKAFMRGFPVPVGVRHTICCMCRDRNPLVIDPQGKFYSCPAFVGREEFALGSLETGIERDNLILMDAPEECKSCSFLPVCSGGCRHVNYSLRGNINALHCTKDVLGELVDASVMMAVAQKRLSQTQQKEY